MTQGDVSAAKKSTKVCLLLLFFPVLVISKTCLFFAIIEIFQCMIIKYVKCIDRNCSKLWEVFCRWLQNS